jgi:kynurenine formamidase
MASKTTWLLAFLCLLAAGCGQRTGYPPGRWVDLSYDLSAQTISWPTSEPFQLDTVAAGITPKGYYYSAFKFSGSEHGGTHIDAPIHFARGRKSVDQIPLSQLIAPAVKIDVSHKARANRDYQISVADIEDWEKAHGRIPDGSIVLFQTGYGQYWPDPQQYLGTTLRGEAGVAALHFPGLKPATAAWLVANRQIRAVGIDTASIDFGQSQRYGSHVTLMELDIPAFENVAHLEQVPALGAQVIALPMKIKGGSGGPLRIVAFVPDARR